MVREDPKRTDISMEHAHKNLVAASILTATSLPAQAADILSLVDSHLHYSHEA